MPLVAISTGPSWEPLDGMRRLTNASTGRLGTELAVALLAAGFEVRLFRGEGATAPEPPPHPALRLARFGTNDDLARAFEELARAGTPVHAVLHAAALCDFRVAQVRTEAGGEIHAAKIPTRQGRVTLELEPTTKVLPRLRDWFPSAHLVGWKYELNGARADALAAAQAQLGAARTDACVLNGAAWGTGFAWCEPADHVIACADTAALIAHLIPWLQRAAPRVSGA